jgi:glucosamine--fructose-6-phosphate aminotransferase (isomerizing)
VKEVAIFKAHKAVPIVIADEGESRFDPYAAGTIQVPPAGPALSFLLATMVGHLFGYHAAAALDRHAERLRRLRGEVLMMGPEPGVLPAEVTADAVEIDAVLEAGGLDAGIGAGTAVRLSSALGALMGRIEPDVYARHHGELAGGAVASLSDAIAELSRPIDAIKHQAKTVTVGISRAEVPLLEGPLLATFRSFGLPLDRLAESHRRLLEAFEPLAASVEGATLYSVSRLDLLGRPIDGSTIRAVRKTGCADEILSRSEEEKPLSGT